MRRKGSKQKQLVNLLEFISNQPSLQVCYKNLLVHRKEKNTEEEK